MLRSVEVTADLVGPMHGEGFHNLYWQGRLVVNLDCFICERTDRATFLERAEERAVCSSGDQDGKHFTAARIAAFDSTSEDERLRLRAVIDFWWTPFRDSKHDRPAMALTRAPWVRLHLGSYCREHGESGETSIQSNMVRPVDLGCRHCGALMATSAEAPMIRLLN
ncbi:hypothetical protein ABZW44_35445 [Streptomyces mirabilis]|uniref:hypothetical protein n=1 Tax=Streptomyces mirabilis TaxID=68239 RepID=UPI0033A1855C